MGFRHLDPQYKQRKIRVSFSPLFQSTLRILRLSCFIFLSLSVSLFGCADLESQRVDNQSKWLDSDPVGSMNLDDLRSDSSTPLSFDLLVEDQCESPCRFAVKSNLKLSRVVYLADQWLLDESTDASSDFEITYSFDLSGKRKIIAIGYGADETELGQDLKEVEVIKPLATDGLPDVPYFYQYSNTYSPSASCQNTSIAMVLAYLGWNGVPDDITLSYGKDYAQSPAGLADLFNRYASRDQLSKRLVPNTSGSLAGLRAELDQGRPVIVHGFFTSYGHVLVVLGYDEDGYYVNDPAGAWSQVFKGGYLSSSATTGKGIYYSKDRFEQAIATYDGYSYTSLWYHVLR